MNPPVRRARTFSAALCSLVAVATTSGQDNRDLAIAHSEAMAEFQAGHYVKAATDLEALVARVEVTLQVEPIFHTIGSAHLNAATIRRPIVAFKNYQAKFPKGRHTRAPPSPSPSRICSARISPMRQRRWRRWRTIPNCVNKPCFSRPRLLKRQTRPTTRFERWKNWPSRKFAPRRNARSDGTGQALRRERRRRQSAAHSRGDPAKDCPSGQHHRAERPDG